MDQDRLWVGTADGVCRTADSGGARRALQGHAVRALCHDGTSLWAILDARTLVRSPDGIEWNAIHEFDGLRAHCLLPGRDGVLVGTSDARLYHLSQTETGAAEPVPAFDRVPKRSRWYTPWGAPADVRSLARGAEGTLYANVHVGGVVRSRDRGGSWEQTMDIEADAHQVLAHPTRPGALVAATAIGLATSFDSGGSWTFLTEGLHATYERAVAFGDDYLLVSASRGDHGRDAALYRTSWPEVGPFERCSEGLPRWFDDNINTGSLVADGAFAAAATPGGRIYVSKDRGVTWFETGEFQAIKCLALGR
ncbi:MAG: WD40/YVTN/BNR-like repeat-containing protein [Candidatus Eiseniibacteriota bacterium]